MTIQPDVQAPALNRRKVGDYVVTYLSDGFLDGSFSYLQGIEASEAESLLKAAHRPPLPHISIASYLIQGRGRTVLVDAGTGGFNGWGERFPVALAAAGVEADDVDTVLLTHAHVDHVGGLTLHGQPLFSKAKVVISETEAKFWRDDAIMASAGADAKPFFDAARLALDAYQTRLKLVGAGEVLPGIDLVHCPAIPRPFRLSHHVGRRATPHLGRHHPHGRHPDPQARGDDRLRRRFRPGASDAHESARPSGERPAGCGGHDISTCPAS